MNEYKILSWNVNGIRAAEKKGFLDWLGSVKPDILALQETKANPAQLNSRLKEPAGYSAYWNSARRLGYSGVSVYTREKPLNAGFGFGKKIFDNEGRSITLEYPGFFMVNTYFPNGSSSSERLDYKLDFYRMFFDHIKTLRKKKKIIICCGDFNTAHTEIDLARPKENSKVSGFLPQERMLIDEFIAMGFCDTFRHFNKEPGHYSWWDYKTSARERNVGWRLDYFFADVKYIKHISKAFILKEVYGSDHCPVGITLKI
ncbi:MAG: exodeoxyribonuclease III [Candidatus Omnitrophota bacterium]